MMLSKEEYFLWTIYTFPQYEELTFVEAFIIDFENYLTRENLLQLISMNAKDYLAHCYIMTNIIGD